MGQPAAYIRYLLRWSGGLLAACLFLLFPIQAAEASPTTPRQTYLSCRATQRPARKPDVTLGSHDHGSMVLVNVRVGFSFGSPPVLLSWFPVPFASKPALQVRTPQRRSGYSFRFLQLIFEHQIAINAP